MALTLTMKQHDTRPIQNISLIQTDPAHPTATIPVDLTAATSAKLLAKASNGSDAFSSVLAFGVRATGSLVWTPVAGDTDSFGQYNAEVEITWSDGGVETYPNDGYFTIQINQDLG